MMPDCEIWIHIRMMVSLEDLDQRAFTCPRVVQLLAQLWSRLPASGAKQTERNATRHYAVVFPALPLLR